MARRKHRKNAVRGDKTPQVSIEPNEADKPETDSADALALPPLDLPTPSVSAATLVEEVQQRCEKLRQWQRDTQASLQTRAETIARREKELDDTQECVERGRTSLELDQDAYKRARLMLDKEKAQTEQTQLAQEAERARLDRDRAELEHQRQTLRDLRLEMDNEWDNLARVRAAQAELVEALEAERTRLREMQTPDSLGRIGGGAPESSQEDGPELSLTDAA